MKATAEQDVERAIALLSAGQRREALETLRSMGAAAAHEPRALQLLGMLFDAPDQRADALALTERAVRIAPGDAQAHFNLAVTVQGFERHGDAIAHTSRPWLSTPDISGR